MDKRGALTVIFTCLLVHFMFVLDMPAYIFNNQDIYPIVRTAMSCGIGVSLLLFPLLGFLADVYVTRYRMIQMSLISLVVILILGLTIAFLSVVLSPQFCKQTFPISAYSTTLALILAGTIASIGIFEANAIQFGMDQLLEASSSQLSSFIHWYFWSMHLGQQVVFCIVLATVVGIPSTAYKYFFSYDDSCLILTTFGSILLLVWLSCIVVCHFY